MTAHSDPRQSDSGSPLDDVGPALARLRRRTRGGRVDLARNIVLNVIAEAVGDITVGGVAEEMGVAQPVASRTIAACIADGLVRRIASQQDGRRILLELTPEGQALHKAIAAEQRGVFEQITAHWDAEDQAQFARYLIRYGHDANAWSKDDRSHQDAR